MCIKTLAACALLIFLSSQSYATANLVNVTITQLNMRESLGAYLFIRTSTPPTIVGCQTDPNWNLVMPLNSDLASKIYAGLLAAQTSQATVWLQGTGTCSGGIEYLDSFTIEH